MKPNGATRPQGWQQHTRVSWFTDGRASTKRQLQPVFFLNGMMIMGTREEKDALVEAYVINGDSYFTFECRKEDGAADAALILWGLTPKWLRHWQYGKGTVRRRWWKWQQWRLYHGTLIFEHLLSKNHNFWNFYHLTTTILLILSRNP